MITLMSLTAWAATEVTFLGLDLGALERVGTVAFPPVDGRRPMPAVPWEDPQSLAETATAWNTRILPVARDLLWDRVRVRATPAFTNSALINMGAPRAPTPASATSDRPRLSRADVVLRVAEYPRAPIGLAAVMIADQFNGNDGNGCFWITWFDGASGVVHDAWYRCGRAAGRGQGAFEAFYRSAVVALERVPVGQQPDQRVAMVLTPAEIEAAVERDPAALAVFASLDSRVGTVVQEAVVRREEEAAAAAADEAARERRAHELELAERLGTVIVAPAPGASTSR